MGLTSKWMLKNGMVRCELGLSGLGWLACVNATLQLRDVRLVAQDVRMYELFNESVPRTSLGSGTVLDTVSPQ
jgi:hypothetical protein